MIILESKRGLSRQDFDFPALEKNGIFDISHYTERLFTGKVMKALTTNGGFKVCFSAKVTDDSKFFTLDRHFPRELMPDVAQWLRDNNEVSKELSAFVEKVIDVQARNLIRVVRSLPGSVLEFQPGDSLIAGGEVLPIYAYIRREGEDGLILETETAFRVYTSETPKAAGPEEI